MYEDFAVAHLDDCMKNGDTGFLNRLLTRKLALFRAIDSSVTIDVDLSVP